MKEKINGISKLAGVIQDISKKENPSKEFFIGKFTQDNGIRLNGITLDDDDYYMLSSVDIDNIEEGTDVLVYNPDDDIIILLGAIEGGNLDG